MNIGITGPFLTGPFRERLGIKSSQYIPSGLGGTPVVLLVDELLRRGNKVTVFTLDSKVKDEVSLQGEQLKIIIGPYRAKARSRALDSFKEERNYLSRAIRREEVNFVHAHWTYEFALGALSSGVPTLVTAHDAPLNILKYDHSPYRILRTFLSWKVLRLAKFVTAVSPYILNHLQKAMRYAGFITVVPNGMPEGLFKIDSIRKDFQPVTFASNFVGWGSLKNGPSLIEAFNLVKKRLPNSRLIMFGKGNGPSEEAEVWSSKKGISRGITFKGQMPYEALLRQMSTEVDILVHPSYEESFSMASVEAMALGIPVIAGEQSGGLPYVLDYGKAGVLVDVKSPKAIAEKMIMLAEDPSVRASIGRKAKDYAFNNFTISKVTDQYETCYQNLLKG